MMTRTNIRKILSGTACAAMFLLATTAGAQAQQGAGMAKGLVLDSHSLLFAQENAEGYRLLTAIEPAAGMPAPLSDAIVRHNTDTREGVELSYSSNNGPDTRTVERTVIVHTTIPLPAR